MQLLIGVGVLTGVAFIGATICFGYPTVIKRISLALYRHAIRTERMHINYTTKLNKDWSRTLDAVD